MAVYGGEPSGGSRFAMLLGLPLILWLLLAIAVGLYGCGALAIALQLGYTRAVAAVTGTSLSVDGGWVIQ